MDILKDLHTSGRKILVDTKSPKNTSGISKPLKGLKVAEPSLDIHQSFVKRAIKEKPKKQEVVEFFQKVCESEEKKL